MSIARFFYPPCSRYQQQTDYEITDDLFHRIVRVLHHRVGDPLILFDGSQHVCEAIVQSIHNKSVTVNIQRITVTSIADEPIFPIALLQCICYGKQLDLIIQKAVELGIQDIYPVISALSPHRSLEWLQKKNHHWEGIAISAAEQCGRNRLPHVHPCLTLTDVLSAFPHQTIFLCDHTIRSPLITEVRLSQSMEQNGHLPILVGPEGGFTAEEIALLHTHTQRMSLGPGILRVETAAISALSYIRLQHLTPSTPA